LKSNDLVFVEHILAQSNDLTINIQKAKIQIAPNEVVGNNGPEVNDVGHITRVLNGNRNLDGQLLGRLLERVDIARSKLSTKVAPLKLEVIAKCTYTMSG
jgi:hypothetical protein